MWLKNVALCFINGCISDQNVKFTQADSNYVWVIKNFIANYSATYIRGLTVSQFDIKCDVNVILFLQAGHISAMILRRIRYQHIIFAYEYRHRV